MRRTPVRLTWLTVLAAFLIAGVAGGSLSPYDPLDGNIAARLKPPGWQAPDGSRHLLGTDELGRDVLSRLLAGARVSILVAILGVGLGVAVGVPLGLISGYLGPGVDAAMMRLVDAFLSLPQLLIALLLAVTLGPALLTVVIAAALIQWARFARMVRGETLALKARPYVEGARALGATELRVMAQYLWPNVRHTVVVLGTLQIGWVVLLEATLSFLGAGIPSPDPSWGSMLAAGRDTILDGWWLSVFPGLAITIFVLAASRLGDWSEQGLDVVR